MERFFVSFGGWACKGTFAVSLIAKVFLYVYTYTRCARGLWCRVYSVEILKTRHYV